MTAVARRSARPSAAPSASASTASATSPTRAAALAALVLAVLALAGCGRGDYRTSGAARTAAPPGAPAASPTTAPPGAPAATTDGGTSAAATAGVDPATARRRRLRELRGTRTVPGAIARAELTRTITHAEAQADRATYARAQALARALPGARAAAMRAVLGNVQELAAARALHADRVRPAFTTLARNVGFWPARPLPAAGQRFSNGTDPLVLQSYPGQGLQVQWVGSWGRVAAYARGCLDRPRSCDRPRLRRAVDRLVALGSRRAGGIAWEGLYHYAQGRPGWASGLVQATAAAALVRARVVLHDRRYGVLAREALAVIAARPPAGTSLPAPGGRFVLLYSFAPGLRVLNADLQAVNALREVADRTSSRLARSLYRSAEPAARAALGEADTGAWSRYSLGGAESTLGYHQLVVGFLAELCRRTRRHAYCDGRARFARYERQAPRLAIGPVRRARAGRAATIAFALSKVSELRVTAIRRGGGAQAVATLRLPRGGHRVRWVPARRGRWTVVIRATGPSGPPGEARRAVRVARPAKASGRRSR